MVLRRLLQCLHVVLEGVWKSHRVFVGEFVVADSAGVLEDQGVVELLVENLTVNCLTKEGGDLFDI